MDISRDITTLLKIKYPIVQAPMLGVSTPAMAAVVSNGGALGSLAVGGLSPEKTRELIRKTKSLTSLPFAVNLFAHHVPTFEVLELEPMKQLLLTLAGQRGYTLRESDVTDFHFYTYHDQVDILIEEKIPIVSFTFGVLDKESVARLKHNGALLIGTATCLEEGRILHEHSIDMIAAQGIEAGGHRGSFIEDSALPEIGLFSLLPSLAQNIPLPIIAAGGIHNRATIRAAFVLGASAVQIGTPFIATHESDAIHAYKQRVINVKDTDTKLTRAFSGRWARGIDNAFMQAIADAGIPVPPYPIQNSMTATLRKLAQQANDSDFTNLWAGQSKGATVIQNTYDVLAALIKAL